MLVYLKPGTKRLSMIMGAVILLTLGARIGILFLPSQMETQATINAITRIDTVEPHVGLVIEASDVKPSDVTSYISMLDSVDAKATWFFPTTVVESRVDIIKQIQEKGHEFGLKGTDEKPMDKLSQVEVAARLTRARQALEKVGINPLPFFYAPLGKISGVMVQTAFDQGFAVIKGSVDGKVIKGKPQEIDKKVQGIRPGDIVVVHFSQKGPVPSVTVFETFAASLKSRGISLVSLSTLAKGVK